MNLHRRTDKKDQQISVSRTDVQERFKKFPQIIQWLIKEIGKGALELNMSAYLVGGPVRDLLLNIPNLDLDFAVEGSAIKLARYLQEKYPEKVITDSEHERFQTARVMVKDLKVDLATTRTETYEHPAALPKVKASDLRSDLLRRDFTINALAVCVNPDRFGELVDSFNGLQDLKKKTIRILHSQSFIDDPTRIVRAARFAARLEFKLDRDTQSKARAALAKTTFDDLGGVRIKNEIKAILDLPSRIKALDLLASFNKTLRFLDSNLKYDSKKKKNLEQAQQFLSKYPLAEEWIVYLGVLIATLDPKRIENLLSSLQLDHEARKHIHEGFELSSRLNQLNLKPKPSDIYHAVHGVSDHSVAIAASLAPSNSPTHKAAVLYTETLKDIRTSLNGEQLLKMGLPKGKIIGRALAMLKDGRLDAVLKTRNDEIRFIKNNFTDKVTSKP